MQVPGTIRILEHLVPDLMFFTILATPASSRSDDLKIELEKATFERDLVEAANSIYKFEIGRKVQQRNIYRMWRKQLRENLGEYK